MRSRTPLDQTVGSQRNTGWRDKSIPTRAIACPACHQPIDVPYVNAVGTPTSNHTARRRVALRNVREAS